MKIVCISDTHGKWKKIKIEPCDILISTGDYSFTGERHLVKNFHEWLNKQPAKHIISVQGNHERLVQQNFNENKELALSVCPRVHFIDHHLVEIEGLKIFGSAWTPFFCNWAWNAQRGEELERLWSQIPEDIDILATHGPPYGVLDVVYAQDGVTPNGRVGCYQLEERIKHLKKLKLHCFGHIHCSYGQTEHNDVKYVNAAICDEMYFPSNKPIIIEI